MKSRIVLLGAPTSGKGTQADLIEKRFGLPVTSVGAIFRREATRRGALGLEAEKTIRTGQLAPDELVLRIVQTWLRGVQDKFVLDGFPRTTRQAERLDTLLDSRRTPLKLALYLDVSEKTILRRMNRRLTCSLCNKAVTLGRQVKQSTDPCPNCGGKLEIREDDRLDVLRQRMEEFTAKTLPVSDFYRGRNTYAIVNADREVDAVFGDVSRLIQG